MEISIPDAFNKPLEVPEKNLMGAGPSNFAHRVRKAMSLPALGHMHPETFKIMDDVKEGVKYLFQTNNSLTFCISGPGHAGMECAFTNLVEDEDIVLIASCGIWGQRAENMAKRNNANVKMLLKKPGEQVTLEETRKCFSIFKPKVFFIAHGESSTGMLQNLSGFGDLCREFECLLVVDCVITVGCVPLFIDKWRIDVAYTGTQKVLNAPPGITPITFSSRALDKITSRKSLIKSYNYDATQLGEYWNCFFSRPRIYHHTISSTLLYGLREAIAILLENGGLEVSWQKHENTAKKFYSLVEQKGMSLFIENVNCRCPSVTSVNVPENVDPFKVVQFAMQKYSTEISGGLGPTVGKIFRIGLMGQAATEDHAQRVFEILSEAVEASRIVSKI